jgi:hypothetical protein
MLRIEVPISESYDEATSTFVTNTYPLDLEHSLVSLSKWEAKFEKPFLSDAEKTNEETLWYVVAMTLSPNVPPEVYACLSEENVTQINNYINGKNSATWFREEISKSGSREIITDEVIRYWMIALNIPTEYETWHLNKLFTQIKVVNKKSEPAKKMARKDVIAQRHALNERRKAQLGTTG